MDAERGWEPIRVPILVGLCVVSAWWMVGVVFYDGWRLDVAHFLVPSARQVAYTAWYVPFGLLAAACVALGVGRALGREDVSTLVEAAGQSRTDRAWMVGGALWVFVVAVLLRVFVFRDGPIADDESCYRFTANLIASGQLWAPSPPDKLFVDHDYMVNDGRWYSQYFVGWPALMAPFVPFGLTGFANALYAALTAPGVFLVGRRVGGAWGARGLLVLFATSPMLLGFAASEMSNTTCLGLIVWLVWAALRSRDSDAPGWIWPLGASLFVAAFFVRPTSALGAGSVWLLLLAWTALRPMRTGPILASAAVCLSGAALFLAVNAAQTGSPLETAYQRAAEYAVANPHAFQYVFGPKVYGEYAAETPVVHFEFRRGPIAAAAVQLLAMWRLNRDLLGWPLSLLFVPLAFGARGARPWIATVAVYMVIHLWVFDPGIDLFGPHHYVEVTLALLVMGVLGVSRAAEGLRGLTGVVGGVRPHHVPVALVAGLVATGWLMHVPAHVRTLLAVTELTHAPFEAVGDVHDAIVFAPTPLMPRDCLTDTALTIVAVRPNPRPDLTDDVLWVNDVGAAENAAFLARFPGRTGYRLSWSDCEPVVERVDPASATVADP